MLNPCDRLKKAREAAGFKSAVDFSRYAKITEVTYRSHENGIRGLKIKSAKKYAELLGVSAAWLLTGETATGNMVSQGKGVKGVKIGYVIDSSMGGVVRELGADNAYTLSFKPDKKHQDTRFIGMLMENEFHGKFSQNTELIFAETDDQDDIKPGKTVLIEEERNGKVARFVGEIMVWNGDVVINFQSKNSRHQNYIIYSEQGRYAGVGLQDSGKRRVGRPVKGSGSGIPLKSGNMRIAGVLIKSINPEV